MEARGLEGLSQHAHHTLGVAGGEERGGGREGGRGRREGGEGGREGGRKGGREGGRELINLINTHTHTQPLTLHSQ